MITAELEDNVKSQARSTSKIVDKHTQRHLEKLVCQHQRPISENVKQSRIQSAINDKKNVNKLALNSRKILPNKFKSREAIVNKILTDKAINTIVSGPLRCDSNCVTVVRQRDKIHVTCKCGQKRATVDSRIKKLQSFESRTYLFSDKAIAQCVEMVDCGTGTQFLQPLSNNKQDRCTVKNIQTINLQPQTSSMIQDTRQICNKMYGQGNHINTHNKFCPNYMGAKRWALNQHSTRGPDF